MDSVHTSLYKLSLPMGQITAYPLTVQSRRALPRRMSALTANGSVAAAATMEPLLRACFPPYPRFQTFLNGI